ncbi:Uncharacterised protein [Mycobacteroides abscessus]|nr:Uncharacterised protein [Mycobacteroides abscessus]CPZ79698.1 Uncharacterised protein [Mycobacteroides abscessus]
MYSTPIISTTRSSDRAMVRCASLDSAPRDATLSNPAYAPTAVTAAMKVVLLPRFVSAHCSVSMRQP